MMNAPIDAGLNPYVVCETRDGVRTLTMNRGERFNALSRDMLAALARALDEAGGDAGVRSIVIAGAGKGFCAGHDLRELRAHDDPAWQRELFDACSRVMVRITEVPQPVIARVHGIAAAAGCQLVSMCDLAVAADSARFALPGLNVGLFCSTPAVGVGRNVARKRVMEMLVTGDSIDAQTALDWGLVNRVVPAADLDAAVKVFTDRIAARSASVIALGKHAFYVQIERTLGDAYGLTSETMTCNLADPDAAEGIDAFLEKRSANWNKGG
jgi:enoyl-CoA hydratase/carnithine racemase